MPINTLQKFLRTVTPLFLLSVTTACESLPPLPDNTTRLVVIREDDTSAFTTYPATLKLTPDDTLQLMPNQYSWIDVKPGDYSVVYEQAWPKNGTCSIPDNIQHGVTMNQFISLDTNKTRYFKIAYEQHGHITCANDPDKNSLPVGTLSSADIGELQASLDMNQGTFVSWKSPQAPLTTSTP
ncbi:MAG: hypothetical protein WCD70_10885 [Alphaproteobacteria bacterium]